jgi:hypothetical protein
MAYLQVISNSGARVNLKDVGSLMGVDNIEAPVNRSGIFQAWLQQSFRRRQGVAAPWPLSDRLRVLRHRFVKRVSASVVRNVRRGGRLRHPGRSRRSIRPAPGAPVCESIPTRPGTRCWPSPAAFQPIVQQAPARTSVGNRAAAACSSVKSACGRPSWACNARRYRFGGQRGRRLRTDQQAGPWAPGVSRRSSPSWSPSMPQETRKSRRTGAPTLLGEQTLYRVPDSGSPSERLPALRGDRRQDQQHRLLAQRRHLLAGRLRRPRRTTCSASRRHARTSARRDGNCSRPDLGTAAVVEQ